MKSDPVKLKAVRDDLHRQLQARKLAKSRSGMQPTPQIQAPVDVKISVQPAEELKDKLVIDLPPDLQDAEDAGRPSLPFGSEMFKSLGSTSAADLQSTAVAIPTVAEDADLLLAGFKSCAETPKTRQLTFISYIFMRKLQIASMRPDMDEREIAMEINREARNGYGVLSDPFQVSSVRAMIPLMFNCARVAITGNPKALLEEPKALTREEEDRFIEQFAAEPTYTLGRISYALLGLGSDHESLEAFARASVALEQLLDSINWPPDGKCQKGVPPYIMHNFYDLGKNPNNGGRLRVDKVALSDILADAKVRAVEHVLGLNAPLATDLKPAIVSFFANEVERLLSPKKSSGEPSDSEKTETSVVLSDLCEKGKGTGSEQALLLSLFLQSMGINQRVVRVKSEDEQYAANLVRMGGSWYFLDVSNGLTIPSQITADVDRVDFSQMPLFLDTPLGPLVADGNNSYWCVKTSGASLTLPSR